MDGNKSSFIRMTKYGINDVVLENDKLWKQKLIDYTKAKDPASLGKIEHPIYITQKEMKERDTEFNPITQKYKDSKLDEELQKFSEKQNLETIVKGFDQEVKQESTYNIINLDNKLKSLNYNEDSYIKKQKISSKKKDLLNTEIKNMKPFNIITNKSLDEQNYISPKLLNVPLLREDYEKSTEGIIPIKNVKHLTKYDKDYNIINNKYYKYNDEKVKVDEELRKLSAAKQIQELKTYDIIKGKYTNPEIERKYQEEFTKKMEFNLKNSINNKIKDKNYIIRNPINNKIYDIQEQKKLDKKDYEKIERYRVKEKLSDYYHSLNDDREDKEEKRRKNGINLFDYKISQDRGYDIINLNDNDIDYHNKMVKDYPIKLMSNWDYLKLKSDDTNNTFNTKPIYKNPYDTSDIKSDFYKYMNKRRYDLQHLSDDILNNVNISADKSKSNDFGNLDNSFDKRLNTIGNVNSSRNEKNSMGNLGNSCILNTNKTPYKDSLISLNRSEKNINHHGILKSHNFKILSNDFINKDQFFKGSNKNFQSCEIPKVLIDENRNRRNLAFWRYNNDVVFKFD